MKYHPNKNRRYRRILKEFCGKLTSSYRHGIPTETHVMNKHRSYEFKIFNPDENTTILEPVPIISSLGDKSNLVAYSGSLSSPKSLAYLFYFHKL